MKILLVLACCSVGVLGRANLVEYFRKIPSSDVRKTPSSDVNGVRTKFNTYYGEWLKFKTTHGKVYEDFDIEANRYAIFKENLRVIEKHNALYKAGKKSYSLGVNMYADMTHEEFKEVMRLDRLMQHNSEGASAFLPPSNVKLPDSVDWRKEGYVTPVKNQGQCGSCWSFSTTGSMEGQTFKKTQSLISLSEQQLVDCSVKYGDHGCDGGLMDYAFDYIKDKGSEKERDYPYEAKEHKCRYNKTLVAAECTGHVDVTQGSEDDLKKAVATVGPVSVAIDASHQSFQLYNSGVYDEPECSSTQLDHGVLAVGYGTDDDSGSDYWLVKNSWGTRWGEEGYVKMSRNKDNQCGIATSASYPLV